MNRRTILAGAAAAAVAIPAPALALPDPAFAAIAARKATVAALKAFPDRGNDAALNALDDADGDAIRTMLSTPPTTLRGMRALVRYVTECELGGDNILATFMSDDYDPADPARERTMGNEVFFQTLLITLERLVPR
jgi:hypothetical protein